uniref:Uncharacterized protein n=1 Tax=Ciona intestinalis TaxID=7719 RepID=H2XKR0_CIOIN
AVAFGKIKRRLITVGCWGTRRLLRVITLRRDVRIPLITSLNCDCDLGRTQHFTTSIRKCHLCGRPC